MKQYDAVAIISDAIIKEGLVQAIFLKGSFARETEDEYSNVDLYCVLKSENINSFEKRISNYLKKYGPVIYFNKLNSKIVCIFENDVLINLHYLEINKIIFEDSILTVYDPLGILKDYKIQTLSYSLAELSQLFNDFLLKSRDFYKAYLRDDLLYCLSIAGSLYTYLGIILRIKYEPDFAKLGLKGFKINNYQEIAEKYINIAKKLNYNSYLEAVKMIYVLLDNYLNNIPILIAEYINFDFYQYTKRKIMSLN